VSTPHRHEAWEVYDGATAGDMAQAARNSGALREHVTGLEKAIDALRSDIGRLRADYRELDQRIARLEREHESAEVPA
jgi:phage shock protein A